MSADAFDECFGLEKPASLVPASGAVVSLQRWPAAQTDENVTVHLGQPINAECERKRHVARPDQRKGGILDPLATSDRGEQRARFDPLFRCHEIAKHCALEISPGPAEEGFEHPGRIGDPRFFV
jgi:hypothetical protein